MPIVIDRNWRVDATEPVEVPLRAEAVWGQMRNLREFLTIDPLHARVHFEPPDRFVPQVGTTIRIEHRFLGFGPDRVGRVLRWREGRGFAVSDLSRRGRHVGFPHVCEYSLEAIDDHRCRIVVSARGVWTARFLPRWLARLWLWWVISATRAHLAAHFRQLAALRARRATR
jgi:hypothetical protein